LPHILGGNIAGGFITASGSAAAGLLPDRREWIRSGRTGRPLWSPDSLAPEKDGERKLGFDTGRRLVDPAHVTDRVTGGANRFDLTRNKASNGK